ncbi:MAG: cytochrome c oxidase assembly protein [Thermomicrobiales bacterium]|nr:cytochrome c oxidase assembly protein [Thermomicrobiales bacterium]
MANWPILHSGVGFPTGWLHSNWRIDPTVVLAAFAIAAAYVLATGHFNNSRPDAAERIVTRKQRVLFLLGCALFIVALGPPLDDWSDNYLLSAHMTQHMLLLFAVAPLWLAGTPSWLLEPLTRQPAINSIGYAVTRFVPALFISNAIIIVWHVPGVYDRALQSEPIHVLQHGSFMIAALIGWWPVLGPLPAWPRLTEPLQCLYLFLTSLPSGVVGAFITFGAVPMYHFYENSPRIFGIALDVDQQLAGLMMWVGGSSIYFLWITSIFLRWGRRADDDERTGLSIPASPEPNHAPTR